VARDPAGRRGAQTNALVDEPSWAELLSIVPIELDELDISPNWRSSPRIACVAAIRASVWSAPPCRAAAPRARRRAATPPTRVPSPPGRTARASAPSRGSEDMKMVGSAAVLGVFGVRVRQAGCSSDGSVASDLKDHLDSPEVTALVSEPARSGADPPLPCAGGMIVLLPATNRRRRPRPPRTRAYARRR
jgi:hypothetical protein